MTDDKQVRSLLTLAAELRDDLHPPVAALVARGRRRRRARAVGSVLTVVVVTAAAFTLPPLIRSLAPVAPNPAHPGRQQPGPTAAQLAHYRWSALPPSPLGPRSSPLLAWTGRYLIELSRRTGSSTDDGAAFDPVTGHWRPIAPVRGNVGDRNAVDVWTGRQLFVTNARIGSCVMVPPIGVLPGSCHRRAGLYDPAANLWTTTTLPRPLAGLNLVAAAWTGRDVILAGVNPTRARLRVAAYDPATRRWQMITPELPPGHSPGAAAMTGTSGRVLLWSLWSRTRQTSKNSSTTYSGIDVLALSPAGRWTNVTGHWPQHTVVADPGYANGTILIPPGGIWCGVCYPPLYVAPAELADAATLSLTQVPRGPLMTRPGATPSIWLWNGRAALAATIRSPMSSDSAGVPVDWISRLAAYDPATRSWHILPAPPGHARFAAKPIWAGRQLLLLTGSGDLLSFHR